MIDVRTFMLVLAIGNIGLALLIAGYARGIRADPAITLWQWAKLVQGAGHALGFARAGGSPILLDMAANTLLVGGIALEVGGYATLLRVKHWAGVLAPVTILELLLMHSARLAGAGPSEMVALVSGSIAVLTGMTAYLLLWRSRDGSLLQRVIGWNDAAFFVVIAMRAYAAAVHGGFGVFNPGMLQTVTYVTGYVVLVVNGFGFLLLCKEQDDHKLEQLATTDALTGLLNRRAFFVRTEQARMLAARQHQSLALMMFDLDHFKHLNDRFGHATGDEALCLFARTAQDVLREHDILGRIGGEEFALCMPNTTLDGALHAAERVRQTVAEAPLLTDGNQYRLTVSIGVVMVEPHEPINAALARADHALYAAKSAGRNQVFC
ncbi:MAG TPA: GGDEF domain-containing protein [Telluria sp.]|nr:GGDEF domain-containing protein [Telluria sp.]